MNGKFKNCEIINWNIETGPELSDYKSSLEKMEELLKSNNLNCAANEGRRFLEHILKNSCEINNVKVKMTDRLTVNDMKNPLFKKIRKTVKGTDLAEYYNEVFTNLELTLPMGNLLSHDNLGSENCSKTEVEDFCFAIKKLYENITCENCKSYLKFEKESKKILCREVKCEDFII